MDPPESATCEVTVEATSPIPGATDHFYRDPVQFVLSNPDDNAFVIAQQPGSTDISDDGLVITWTPNEPLLPLTDHSVTLDYCGGSPNLEFSTSEYGESLSGHQSIVGRSYAFDLTKALFVSGGQIGETLSSMLGRDLLIQVSDASENGFDARIGLSTGNDNFIEQDLCVGTYDLDEIDLSQQPGFSFEIQQLWLPAWGGEMTLFNLLVHGTFSPDAMSLGGVDFSFTLDVRDLADVLSVESATTLCELAVTLESSCQPCSDGGPWCVSLGGVGLQANEVGLQLEPVAPGVSDPNCE